MTSLRAHGRAASRQATGALERMQAMVPPEVAQAIRYKAKRDGVTEAQLLRTGASMVLGYCPTCLRALDHGGES